MRRLGLLCLLTLLAAPACRDKDGHSGTALLVSVSWSPRVSIEQLRFRVLESETRVGNLILLPEGADGDLAIPQSLRIKLPDRLAGKEVTLEVDGLFFGTAISRGTSQVTVRAGLESAVAIELGRSPSALRFVPPGLQLTAGECGAQPLRLALSDQSEPAAFPEETFLSLESSSAVGQFFADPGCTSPLTQVVIPQGVSEVSAYYRDAVAGQPTLTARHQLKLLEPAYSDAQVGPGEAKRLALVEVIQPAQAGNCLRAVVESRDSFDNPAPTRADVYVGPQSSSGTTTFYPSGSCNGGVLTTTIIPKSGTSAVFYFRDNTAGRPTLSALASGFAAASLEVLLAPGPANKLVFRVQPSGAIAAAELNPGVAVGVVDSFGNLASSSSSDTVSLALDPPEGPLSVTSATTSSGVASFQGLSLARAGTFQLIASAPGLGQATSDPFTIAAGPAAQLAFLDQPQDAQAKAVLPRIRVGVQDSAGNPVASTVRISLSGPGLGGTVAVDAVQGIASFTTLFGTVAGAAHQLTANASGLAPATSAAFEILPGPAASVAFEAPIAGGVAGTPLGQVRVKVFDESNNLATNFAGTVVMTLDTGAAPGGTPVVAASGGVATFSNLQINTAGAYTLRAQVGALAATSNSFSITAAAPSQLVFLTQPVDAVAGVQLPQVRVALQDSYFNTVPQAGSISLALSPAGPGLTGTLTASTVSGVATFSDLKVTGQGQDLRLLATGFNLQPKPSNPFDIAAAGSPGLQFVNAISNPTIAGTAFPNLQVRTVDSAGGPLAIDGLDVTLTLATGSPAAPLQGTTTATTVGGIATFPGVMINKAGAGYALRASATTGYSNGSSSTFEVRPGPLSTMSFQALPPPTAVAGVNLGSIQVKLADSFENPVDADVTLALQSAPSGGALVGPPATVGSLGGVATFSGFTMRVAGAYQLIATTGPKSTVPASTLVNPAAAARLKFGPMPSMATAGQEIASFTVRAEDPFGNRATPSDPALTVALQIESSSPAGDDTLSAAAQGFDIQGNAVFVGAKITRAAHYTLRASAGSLTSDLSASLEIKPAVAATLEFVPGNLPAPAVSLVPFSKAVEVKVKDAFGNLTSEVAQVSLSLESQGPVLGGTTAVTPVAGVATFSNLTVDKAGGPYKLRAQAAGTAINPVVSAEFDVVAGVATKLVFIGWPVTVDAGAVLSPVLVSVRDQADNEVNEQGRQLSLSLGPQTGGALFGVLTADAVGGIADFNAARFGGLIGSYSLVATSGTLYSATSPSFEVKAGTAHHLRFTQQPTATNVNQVISPAPAVRVEDQWDNPTLLRSGEVQLSISGSSTLSGTTLVSLQDAMATFSSVQVTAAAQGLKLTATLSGSSISVQSEEFDVRTGAVKLRFSNSPLTVVAGACSSALTLQAVDSFGSPNNVQENHVLNLSSPSGAVFSLSNSCTPQTTQVTLAAGTSQVSLYFKSNKAGSTVLSASDSSSVNPLTAASQTQQVNPGPPVSLVFGLANQRNTESNVCSCDLLIHPTDSLGNITKVSSDAVVNVGLTLATGPGQMELGCATAASNIPIVSDGGFGGGGGTDGGGTDGGPDGGSSTITILAGSDTATFRFKSSASGLVTLYADNPLYGTVTQDHTLVAPQLPSDTCPFRWGDIEYCRPDNTTCVEGTNGALCYDSKCNAVCTLPGSACTSATECCSGSCCGGLCRSIPNQCEIKPL